MNESVIVVDLGYLWIIEDKKYMVLNLYSGVNYSEERPQDRSKINNRPFRRDKFDEQTIRVKVMNFDFNRRDEGVFRNMSRMLNLRELNLQEDTLIDKYYGHLRNYMLQLNINPILSQRTFNLSLQNDSLKRPMTVEHDSVFNFDSYFSGIDKWVQARIAQSALDNARNNMQNVNLYEAQLYERKKNINKFGMEMHRKFTLSLAVLIFFFIGAPLGAIIRKGGLGMPVVVSILLFIAYYIVSMTGEKSAREDVWQMFTGMWFSTFVFLPIGVWLSYKAANDAAIMSSETYVKFFSKIGLGKLFRKKDKQKY